MGLRARMPARISASRASLRALSLIGIAALVAMILFDQRDGLAAATRLPVALPFCVLAMTAGLLIGVLARLPDRDRFTLLIELSIRNLALVAIIGTAVLGQVKLVLFATLFFLVELPLVLMLIALRARLVNRLVNRLAGDQAPSQG